MIIRLSGHIFAGTMSILFGRPAHVHVMLLFSWLFLLLYMQAWLFRFMLFVHDGLWEYCFILHFMQLRGAASDIRGQLLRSPA